MNRFVAKVTLATMLPALLFGVLLASAPAQGAKRMEVVVQDDAVFLYQNYYNREVALAQLRALGASRLRMNVLWWQTMPTAQAVARTKPARVVYDWSRWDAAIARARAYGMKVQLALTGDPPAWAAGNRKPPNQNKGFKPNAREFGRFAREAARHFGTKVDRYSIWNEPNWFTWLSPLKQAPLLYRALYKEGYNGIKGGNRRAKVFMGETAPYEQRGKSMPPVKFLREVFCVDARYRPTRAARRNCRGGALKADGYAHHPYDFTKAPNRPRPGRDNATLAQLGRLTSALDRLSARRVLRPSVRRLPLLLTEYGYFVRGPRRLPESVRVKYTVQAFKMAQRNPRVQAMTYYVLVSPPLDNPSTFFDLGLIETNGRPRDAYFGLRNWALAGQRRGLVAKPGRCLPGVRC